MSLKTTWDKTAGYKTPTALIVWLLLRLVDYKFPEALDAGTEAVILDVAAIIGILGLGDKIRRWWERRKDNKEETKEDKETKNKIIELINNIRRKKNG